MELRTRLTLVAACVVAVLVAASCEVTSADGSRFDCRTRTVVETYTHRHVHRADHHRGPRHPHPANYLHAHRRKVQRIECTQLSGPTTSTTTTSTTTTSTTTTTPPGPAGPAAVVQVGVSGKAGGGTLALDDVEVRGGAGDSLYLSDNFSANTSATPLDYSTGSVPTFVTSDLSVNTSPLFGGFGLPPGVWFNPLTNPDLGTPTVVSGRLRPPSNHTLGLLVWDLTSEPVKVSFKVPALPSAGTPTGETATASFIDPVALLPRAGMLLSSAGVQLQAGDTTTGVLSATGSPTAVSAGDRLTLSRSGTVYRLWRNATLLATVDVTDLGTATGTVTGVGDPSTCTVYWYPGSHTTGGDTTGVLGSTVVSGDGSFSVPTLAGVPVKLRTWCTEGASGAWLGGGTDADHSGSTVVSVTAGATVPVGAINVGP